MFDQYEFIALEGVCDELAELCLYPQEHDTTYQDIEERVQEAFDILGNILHKSATKYLINKEV